MTSNRSGNLQIFLSLAIVFILIAGFVVALSTGSDSATVPAAAAGGSTAGGATAKATPPGPVYEIVRLTSGKASVRTRPYGHLVDLLHPRTEFGGPQILTVVVRHGPWLGISTPALPADHLGWVRFVPDRMRSYATSYSLHVDLSTRRLTLRRGAHDVDRFPITIGGSGSETPRGRFGITDSLHFAAGSGSPYGCCALALTANQTIPLPGWTGGDRIAIHGTDGPVGLAESHGCIRATNAAMHVLFDRVPVGAPVFIRD